MSNEDDIMETVDDRADMLDPPFIEGEAERLGLTVEELLHRICVEVQSRLA